MPPVLDPSESKVDGLAFLGLSLTRNSELGHPNSETHQTAFDWNEIQDRDYNYLASTNDDGWLVGGGEPGPPLSYKLAAKDSAHVEIMRIGTFNPEWGGVALSDILEALSNGHILVPQIEIVPTAVVANGYVPPELEIRFDMEPATYEINDPLPTNWQLRFLHNQLFEYFTFPSRFCPGAFHSTILRKAEFRSAMHREKYYRKCQTAIDAWRVQGPQPLVPVQIADSVTVISPMNRDPKPSLFDQIYMVDSEVEESFTCNSNDEVEEKKQTDEEGEVDGPIEAEVPPSCQAPASTSSPADAYQSGLWLFTDRNTITHQVLPNFLPPYNTPEKKQIIYQYLKNRWDDKELTWKPLNETVDEDAAQGAHSPTWSEELESGIDCGALSMLLALD